MHVMHVYKKNGMLLETTLNVCRHIVHLIKHDFELEKYLDCVLFLSYDSLIPREQCQRNIFAL